MTDDDEANDEVELSEQPYGDLMNLARSAREQFESVEIDTDAPKKDELIDALEEYSPEGSREDDWTIEVDGSRQEVDLLQVQTPDDQSSGSSGPSDETILYGLTRAGTTEERIEEIREAIEGQTDYVLQQKGSTDDPKWAVVLPASEQEGYEEAQEDESDDGDSAESESEYADADSDSDEGEESEEDEESESDESDGSDGESESEDDSDSEDSDEDADEDEDDSEEDTAGQVPFEEVVDRLEDNNTKDELYEKAVEADIDGRTDMNKSELAHALVEHRRDQGEEIAPPADD